MTQPAYAYRPKQVDAIVVRPFDFDFPDDLEPRWIPGHLVRAQFFNGVSLTMPYLEPFLVKTMREASEHVDSAELREDIRGFNGQEASHYKCHRRLNALLKANGFPELQAVEDRIAAAYERLAKRDLRTRLAYSAGFECMTNGFTTWLINKRHKLFAGAESSVTSFWLMHMVEETEHKTVAFDVYMAVCGAYWPRAKGVFHGSFHVIGLGLVGMAAALRRDGPLLRPRRMAELAREACALTWNVLPFLLRALLPWHDPRGEADPAWMQAWTAGHATFLAERPAGSRLPLVDTSDPVMPVPFGP
ncbi:MAG TPA: metal-dependent hydrolase [Pseudomonadales bacterium]|nr:metal-dependent hydrolase [Pseudomonadales bacterium]